MFKAKIIISIFLIALVFSPTAFSVSAQDLPSSIRGYKVHKDPIKITPQSSDSDSPGKVSASIGEAEMVKAGFGGLTFAVPLEFTSESQSGKIEIIDFHNLKVNGIPVNAEEYLTGFSFKKNDPVMLPEPLKFVLAPERVIQAAIYEAFDSKAEWNVTGRMFVFGRFRKFGFNHKRVIPVDIDITIPNPLYK